jgi:hypothetical protein
MSQQTINIGSAPNDGTGDPLRTAFTKCNSNFTELYTAVSPAATVTSFNTRVGAISLSSLDVTNALTYTPLNKAGDTASGLIVFNSGWVASNLSTVSKNTGSLSVIPAAPLGTVLRAINVDGTATRINADSYVNAGTPAAGLTMRGARGTGAVPAAIVQGDLIGTVTAHGFGATSFQATSTGLIGFVAEGTSLAAFTDSSQPTGITFQVTPSSSIAKSEQMHLSGSGVLSVLGTVASTNATTGTIVSSGGVGVTGAVNIGGSLALQTVNANTIAVGGLPASDTGTLLRLDNVDGTSSVALLSSYVNAGNPNSKLTLRGARGTGASPTAIQSGDVIGGIGGEGYGTSFLGTATGQVNFVAEVGAFTAISQPTAISFQVTASGSVAPSEQMRLTSAGVLTLSSATVSTTAGTGALVVTGGVGVGGAMNVTGTVGLAGITSVTNNTTSTTTGTGALVVTGGVGIGGTMTVGGVTKLTSGTASTTTGTGALVVTGGVGVGGAAYVGGNVVTSGNYAAKAPVTNATTTYTQLATDNSIIFNSASAVTVTLLTPSTVPGQILYVKSTAAGVVSSSASNVVALGGGAAQAQILSAAGKFAMLQSDGTNWIVMMAN